MSEIDTTPFHGITLYSHSDDYHCHTVRFLLAEKNVTYRLIILDETTQEDLAQLNPYATLPTLVDNATKLFKATIINEYLDERYRQQRLYADAPAERAEQRQLLWRIEQDWFKLADILLCHPDSLNTVQQHYAQRELADILQSLSPLFQHYPYFMSEQLSILDCTLAPMLLRLQQMQIEISPKHAKGLLLYCKRMFSRDSFRRSLTTVEQTRYADTLKHFNG